MSKGATTVAVVSADPLAPQIAASALIVGRARLGERSLLSEGAAVRGGTPLATTISDVEASE